MEFRFRMTFGAGWPPLLRCLICCIGLGCHSFSSAHEVRGTVRTENNIALEGVGVYNKATSAYTYTNISGYFELDDVSAGNELYFYSLGYETRHLVIEENQLNSSIEVILKESAVSLDQVVVVSGVNALSHLIEMDLKTNPVKSSQEVLRKVPGLFIGQHAGGGKAEQIFLRGFDLDHGTDISISLDGMPVNMVSHAHGQGYADMHFIIPETIDNIDFGKGPYYPSKGNFTTTGYVSLKTKETIDHNLVSIEAGQFNTLRGLSMLKLADAERSKAYLASEFNVTDGPFDAPQHFNRFNFMARYHYNNHTDEKLDVSVSHFKSKWDASGQVPQRAIIQGLIGRFGAIDDTEGGNTGRSNIWISHNKQLDEHQNIQSSAFLSLYDFELFSNFTFFLRDPVNGDQIRQKEDRVLFGADTKYTRSFHLKNHDARLKFEAGLGFRYDHVNNEQLSHTKDRNTLLERLAFGNVDELNTNVFGDLTYNIGKWTLNPGLRMDLFRFQYEDLLSGSYSAKSVDKAFMAPKFNILYGMSQNLQLFLKTGSGFHSNDTRVVTANNGKKILPGAIGADLGAIIKPADRLLINAALWTLSLQQEFVYVGDEAVVEPSGKTRRYGTDLGLSYQMTDHLFLNGDINYTHGRSVEDPKGKDYIPLAPDLTATGGINVRDWGNFSGGLSFRYLKDRPANEDRSIVARGYFVSDLNLNYSLENWTIGVLVENLFDTEWNETQFATESRLAGEQQSTEEIHFTPGTPFYIRGKIALSF